MQGWSSCACMLRDQFCRFESKFVHERAKPGRTRPRSVGPMILSAANTDLIRIRKYPNRRLYDTSRSTHLTHDEVLAIVRRGNRVQISDSRSEADITNEVLLQILVARDPALVSALPTQTLHALARSTPDTVGGESTAFAQLTEALRVGLANGSAAAPVSFATPPSSPPTSVGFPRIR